MRGRLGQARRLHVAGSGGRVCGALGQHARGDSLVRAAGPFHHGRHGGTEALRHPVMGHLGLTPQSIHILGGFHPQGRTTTAARRIFEDALLLEEAGCFSLVLESIPARLAELISKRVSIPTIGIGAGAGCDGQVLVVHDMLGLFDRFTPSFVKKYADLHG